MAKNTHDQNKVICVKPHQNDKNDECIKQNVKNGSKCFLSEFSLQRFAAYN